MIPWIRTTYESYWLAFLFPAVLMAFAFIAFAAGKPFYAKEVISRTVKSPEERALQWQVVGQIGGLFLLVMFFWAIFDQSASTWIYFAQTYMDCTVLGYHIDPEQVQALNPILIVAFLPFSVLLWTYLDSKGMRVRATSKLMLGFFLTAACMGTMAVAGYSTGQAEKRDMVKDGKVVLDDAGQAKQVDFLPPERKVSVIWQMAAYLLITLAEILISVTGLELAFVAAPKSMKSFVTALWLLTVGLANLLLNVPLSRIYPDMHPGQYFAMLTAMLLVIAVIFHFVAKRFNRITQEMEEASKAAALALNGQAAGGQAGGLAALQPSTGVMDKTRREGIVDKDQA
jgi:dipeptide/tripeptide permease